MPKSSRVRRYPIPTRRHPPRELIPAQRRLRRWYQIPSVVASALFLCLIVTLALSHTGLSGCDPFDMDLAEQLERPSWSHWWGTDQFGRDILCRALYGGRISLSIGIASVLTALLPGSWLGLVAGYYGGWIDTVIGRLTDVMLAFPRILFALLIVAWLGPTSANAALALGLGGIPQYVRLARSSTIRVRKAWFVRAAYVVGCTDARIIARHVLPNVLPSLVVLATLDVAWAILNASTLSFLGLGTQPPTPEWGAMINAGRGFLRQAPWISLAPSALMTATILAANLLGDGLRAAFGPHMN
jgi:peptide/nickel transport system permease protein